MVASGICHMKACLVDLIGSSRISPAPQVDFGHIAKTLLVTSYPDQEPNLAEIEQRRNRKCNVSTTQKFSQCTQTLPPSVFGGSGWGRD